MKKFAVINENNIVTNIVVSENVLESNWIEYGNQDYCAYIGATWNPEYKKFVGIQPYPSWSLDQNLDWQPPTPKPEEGYWNWNEETTSWVET
jgi:hypothetical protein